MQTFKDQDAKLHLQALPFPLSCHRVRSVSKDCPKGPPSDAQIGHVETISISRRETSKTEPHGISVQPTQIPICQWSGTNMRSREMMVRALIDLWLVIY